MRLSIEDGQEVVEDAGRLDNIINVFGVQINGSKQYSPPGCSNAKGILYTPSTKKNKKNEQYSMK